MVAGGANLGLKHGVYWKNGQSRLSNLYLSILRSMGVEKENFSDSTGTLTNSIFARA
jgi:sugar/nucleoside kinase (ribokinase family)